MQLYGDIFFLYNLIMDYIVLKMTLILWGSGKNRLFLWCIAANICYTASVCVIGISPVMPFVFLAAALFFGARPHTPLRFFGMLITAYSVTFLLGSLSLGAMALFGLDGSVTVIFATVLLFLLKKISDSPKLCEISGLHRLEIFSGGKSVVLTALSDSGNGLEINGSPVVIADKKAVSPLLPYIKDTFPHPCRTVTGEAELICFYADTKIDEKTGRNCIAISSTPINGSFEALINTELLKEM